MKSLPLRLWLIASMTCALGAAITRLAWALAKITNAGSLVIVILLMLAAIGSYALLLYLTIKPSLKKLKSRTVAILTTVIVGGAFIGCIIHYIRFGSSPHAFSLLSMVIASLLLAGGLGICGLVLWIVWRSRRTRKG